MASELPRVALVMGDPAGISPELTAKLLALDEVRAAARIVVLGDRRIFEQGAQVAGVNPQLTYGKPDQPLNDSATPHFIDLENLSPNDVERCKATPVGGAFASDNFTRGLRMAKAGEVDAVCFTPFNKQAMRYIHPGYEDEIGFVSNIIGFTGVAREFNVLEGLWNARVTSHIPLAKVASTITTENILAELELADRCLREAGIARPRIAVAAINPHAGDGGNFGREEIEIIEPAVKTAIERGFNASGPYPADTVFVRARSGAFDAVLTMYHDQGQIAMKLMGFDRGVTLLGGFPFPVCTPAHGTAYDIAWKGIANVGATRAAFLMAAGMAAEKIAGRAA